MRTDDDKKISGSINLFAATKYIYDSIHLNLGIKRIIAHLGVYIKTHGIPFVDNHVVFPLYELLRRYLTKRLIYHYGAAYRWDDKYSQKSQNIDLGVSNLGYGLVHEALIRNLRPKRVLCVGSMYGFIPYMMARACSENRFGHVDFVDAGYDMNDKRHARKHYYGQGFWHKSDPHRHFKYLLKGDYIRPYIMTTEGFAHRNRYTYDYIYLDADHSYKGLVRDLKLFWPRLNEGGIICFHDIHFDHLKLLRETGPEFKKLVKDLRFEVALLWRMLKVMPYKLELPNGYSGIGFIQKLGIKDLPKNL